MKYSVVFTDLADDELAAAWLKSTNRKALTDTANQLDSLLSHDPLNAGESRDTSLNRIIWGDPIGMTFEVIPDDYKVIVHSVWLTTI